MDDGITRALKDLRDRVRAPMNTRILPAGC